MLRRRQAQVDDLLTLLDWADLHSVDPQSIPGAQPIEAGGDRLVQIGGDGTPLSVSSASPRSRSPVGSG